MKEEDYTISYCFTSTGDWAMIVFWACTAITMAVLDPGDGTVKGITFLTTMLSLVTAVLKINAQGVKVDQRSKAITFLPAKKKPMNISDMQKIAHRISARGRDEVKVYFNGSAPKEFKISKEDYKDFTSRISRLNPDIEIIDEPAKF